MYVLKKILSILSLTGLILILANAVPLFAQNGTVVEVINSSPDHAIFAELLDTSELDQVISQDGPYTVIAPTDNAFQELDLNLGELRNTPDQAQDVVMEHLFQGEVLARDAENALDIMIIQGDIRASNGIIHITDEVIGQD